MAEITFRNEIFVPELLKKMWFPCPCTVYLLQWWRCFKSVWRAGAVWGTEAGLLHSRANQRRKRLGAVCSEHPRSEVLKIHFVFANEMFTNNNENLVYLLPPFAEQQLRCWGLSLPITQEGPWKLQLLSPALTTSARQLNTANKRIYLLPSFLTLYKSSSTSFPYSSNYTSGKYLHKPLQDQSLLTAVPLIHHLCCI